ncbi:HAD-IIIC family phosphatase [Aurantiacibacter rhizosphaerae]|uniref:HAD-IIIC family phosphatase n=1 Tax=Aurantiacibacter rhizosphaerae TaxID=2691582 RepID=A0A844XAY8_9SPHN|nr:HAD family hydrolase [Aurantiacibacter rhizosphaerae]MWV27567.1 HAD-IIIC family phosphatase [Aurantiacibacter rhizosphaerae]
MTSLNFPWRPPLANDWADRLAEIEAVLAGGAEPDYVAVKTLANQQLGMREQLRTERLAKKLQKADFPNSQFTPVRLGLLGSRTLSYLPAPLAAAGLARGLSISSVEAPYDSVASFAFSPADCFGCALDALLVVLDESAFASERPMLDQAAEDEALADAENLVTALAAAAKDKTGCQVIFATLPAALQVSSAELATPGSSARFRQCMNLMLAEGAMQGRWLLWDQAALASRVGMENWLDPVRYHAAKIPFSVDVCPLAADSIAGVLAAMKGKAARGLVLDLDNTLWGGVIGDDGLAGIRLGQNSPEGEAFVAFQNFIITLRKRGVVLAVCSKNTDEIAREPFRNHSEMVIKEDHVAVFQANWSDKATNIKSIAETLSLGLESFVFIDDNAAERERVRQELPLVSTIEVGDDPSFYIERIAQSGLFDHLPLNTEDISRAESYGGRAAAAEIRAKIGNYDDYLTSLGMRMTIAPFDDAGRSRITQLINKSNQFNLTTRRYGEEDVRKMEDDPDLLGWQVRLEDKFAAHGMIGVVIVRKDGAEWSIDSWLQSCRVLERGVEQCVMNSLFETAALAGVETIRATYIPTDRNAMVADFYTRLGFEIVDENDDGSVTYACAVDDYTPHKTFIDVTLA